MLTGGAQKEAERKWHLKFGENRGTKRPLMKSIAEFKRDWKKVALFHFKDIFCSQPLVQVKRASLDDREQN